MEKNYYDILEINKNASPEIVEKAYKTLAKKYHPDLQKDDLKLEYEEKLKLINEAYEVLSNEQKRVDYDKSLQEEILANEKFKQSLQQNSYTPNQQQIQPQPNYNEPLKYEQEQYNKQVESARQKAYHDAYIQDLRNRGYKIRYKKTFKDYIRIILTIIAVIVVFVLLWQIPFVQNYFVDLYNSNSLIHSVIDMFMNIFSKK